MVQEDVENRTVNLAVTTTKLSARAICHGIRTFLAHRKHQKVYPKEVHGKQSVKKLLGQPQAVMKMPLNDASIREFAHLARKYGVDFAVTPAALHHIFQDKGYRGVAAYRRYTGRKTDEQEG